MATDRVYPAAAAAAGTMPRALLCCGVLGEWEGHGNCICSTEIMGRRRGRGSGEGPHLDLAVAGGKEADRVSERAR